MVDTPHRIFRVTPKSATLLRFHHDPPESFELSLPSSQLQPFISVVAEEIFTRIQKSIQHLPRKIATTLLPYLLNKEIPTPDHTKIDESLEKFKKNRLIWGDCLQGMAALYAEGYQNQIQMVYLDPPFGIEYNAGFYSGTQKVEGYSDKWTNGLESYLDFLRSRLYLARELLHPSGSIFVQISDRNVHYVRCLLDEVFGIDNWINQIMFRTAISTNRINSVGDYLLWYAKDKNQHFKRDLYIDRPADNRDRTFTYTEEIIPNEKIDGVSSPESEIKGSAFKPQELVKRIIPGKDLKKNRLFLVEWQGKSYTPPDGFEWRWDENAIIQLIQEGRVCDIHGKLYGKRYEADFPAMLLTNMWTDTTTSTFAAKKHYTVHTNPKVIQRCIALTTHPGDLILDPMIGSGTTAVVAEQMGRQWIGFDTSSTAILATLNWLLGSDFPIYAWDATTTDFEYQHLTRRSLSQIAHIKSSEDLRYYDRPRILQPHGRHCFPFTFEFVESVSDIKATTIQTLSIDDISSIELIFPEGEKYSLTHIKSISLDAKKLGLRDLNVRLVHAQFDNYTVAVFLWKLGVILTPAEFLATYNVYRDAYPTTCCIVAVSGISPKFWQDLVIRNLFNIEYTPMCILSWYSADLGIPQLKHESGAISLTVSGQMRFDPIKSALIFSVFHGEKSSYHELSSDLLAIWGVIEISHPFKLIYCQMPRYRKFLSKELRPVFDRAPDLWAHDLSQFNAIARSSSSSHLLWGIDNRGTFHFGWDFGSSKSNKH